MGNAAAGARLGDGSLQGQPELASNESGPPTSIELQVVNRLGLQFSLEQDSFASGDDLNSGIPKTIDDRAVLRITGTPLVGSAVYACQVAHSQAAPQEMTFMGKKSEDAQPEVVVWAVDKRGTASKQLLAFVTKQQGGLFSMGCVCVGAVYGSFDHEDDAIRNATNAAVVGSGERGLCKCTVTRLGSMLQVMLEIYKTNGGLLAQRSSLLDAVERQSHSAAVQPATALRTVAPASVVSADCTDRKAWSIESVEPKTQVQACAGSDEVPELQSKAKVSSTSCPTASGEHCVSDLQTPPVSQPNVELDTDQSVTLKEVPVVNACLSDLQTPPVSQPNVELDTNQSVTLKEVPVVNARPSPTASSGDPEQASPSESHEAAPAEEKQVQRQEKQPPQQLNTDLRTSRAKASGALALQAKAAADEAAKRRCMEAKRIREEEALAQRLREEEATLIQRQDQEFHQSLLMDQLKDLLARQGELAVAVARSQADVEESTARCLHAEQRLGRFGENPRLAAEAQKAAAQRDEASARLDAERTELADADTQVAQHNEILTAAMIA